MNIEELEPEPDGRLDIKDMEEFGELWYVGLPDNEQLLDSPTQSSRALTAPAAPTLSSGDQHSN